MSCLPFPVPRRRSSGVFHHEFRGCSPRDGASDVVVFFIRIGLAGENVITQMGDARSRIGTDLWYSERAEVEKTRLRRWRAGAVVLRSLWGDKIEEGSAHANIGARRNKVNKVVSSHFSPSVSKANSPRAWAAMALSLICLSSQRSLFS